jgi:hypothetical protein
VFYLEEGKGSEAEKDDVGGFCEDDGGRCVLRGEEGVCEKFEDDGEEPANTTGTRQRMRCQE